MTCIVGLVNNETGKVYMGADAAGVGGSYNHMTTKEPKVFINEKFIIGYTTSFRMGQLLQYSLKVPKQKKSQRDYEFMCTTFIETVIKCFKDNEYARTKDSAVSGGNFLVGYKKRLYEVQNEFSVMSNSLPYDAVGCGADFALGAIHSSIMNEEENINFTGGKRIKPEGHVLHALETAAVFSAGVSGPFTILKL